MNQKTDTPWTEGSATQKLVTDQVSNRQQPLLRALDESVALLAAEAPDRVRITAVLDTSSIDPAPTNTAPTNRAVLDAVPQSTTTPIDSTTTPAPPDTTTVSPTTTTGAATTTQAARAAASCTVDVVVGGALTNAATSAISALNAATPNIVFTVGSSGPISIDFGGDWPPAPSPLGWTAPDRRTILINPDHPAASIDTVLAEVIVHEMGHVLIGPDHVNDGTVLDPELDGRIVLGEADRRVLGTITCAQLGL